MNNTGDRESDALGRYIVPGKIEKAPDGFTERVMIQIGMENAPVRSHQRSVSEKVIPFVAFFTALVLIIAAGLTKSTGVLFLDSASHVLKSLNTWLPDINIKTIPGLSVPSILFYISTGILILAVFDIALNRLFHSKEKREGRSL